MHALRENLDGYLQNQQFEESARSPEWNGNERRCQERIQMTGPIRIKVLNPMSSTAPSGHAQLVDRSDKGLKVRVPRFITPGAVVQMRLKEAFALGEVRYCLPYGPEFHVGVRLLELFPQRDSA
jgi:PilZ domain